MSFRNSYGSPVDLYWDSNAPVSGLKDYDFFTELFRGEGEARFKRQTTIQPNAEVALNSYESHVFVGVDPSTKTVVWVGKVLNPKDLKPDEKTAEGQLCVISGN